MSVNIIRSCLAYEFYFFPDLLVDAMYPFASLVKLGIRFDINFFMKLIKCSKWGPSVDF